MIVRKCPDILKSDIVRTGRCQKLQTFESIFQKKEQFLPNKKQIKRYLSIDVCLRLFRIRNLLHFFTGDLSSDDDVDDADGIERNLRQENPNC